MPTIDVQTTIDQCAQSGGGTVMLPAGTYDCVSPWVIPARVIVRGPGSAYGASSAFVGKFDVAIAPEFCVHVAGAGAQLHDVAIQGVGLTARAKTGVLISGHASLVSGVSSHYHTDFGFYVNASSGLGTNANGFVLDRCRAVRCGRAGFYVNGAETNAGRVSGCTAESNEGYGFFESSFLGNLYLGCHSSLNPLGNYAQGGSIEDPTVGGVSNYSAFVDCYSEGSAPSFFRAAQIHVSGGNLIYTARGWDGAPYPGTRSGYRSKLRFEDDTGVSFAVPGPRGVANIKHGANRAEWQLMQDWIGSPAWLANTVAVARHGKTGWLVPYAATHEGHAAGPGRVVQGTPIVNSPFRFVLRREVSLLPGVPLLVQISSDLLKETSGGYLGSLYLEAPSVLRPIGATPISHSGWEWVSSNSVATVLKTDDANQVVCVLVLSGGRVES